MPSVLDVSAQHLTDADMDRLLEAMKFCDTIETLDLRRNALLDDGMRAVARIEFNQRLVNVHIDWYDALSEGMLVEAPYPVKKRGPGGLAARRGAGGERWSSQRSRRGWCAWVPRTRSISFTTTPGTSWTASSASHPAALPHPGPVTPGQLVEVRRGTERWFPHASCTCARTRPSTWSSTATSARAGTSAVGPPLFGAAAPGGRGRRWWSATARSRRSGWREEGEAEAWAQAQVRLQWLRKRAAARRALKAAAQWTRRRWRDTKELARRTADAVRRRVRAEQRWQQRQRRRQRRVAAAAAAAPATTTTPTAAAAEERRERRRGGPARHPERERHVHSPGPLGARRAGHRG